MPVVHTSPPPKPGMEAGRGAWLHWGHIPKDANGRTVTNYLFKSLASLDGSKMDTPEHMAVHWAIAGTQRCINAMGYRHPVLGPIPITGLYGPRTKWGVKWFQKTQGLVDDGIFGRKTAQALFLPLTVLVAVAHRVPPAHLAGMFTLESSWDPGAVSTWYWPINGTDQGLGQLNERSYPKLSDEDAFNPLKAIPIAAQRLAGGRAEFDGKGPALQDVCSIAQHNNPMLARQWYEIGSMGEDTDIYKYVHRIMDYGQKAIDGLAS